MEKIVIKNEIEDEEEEDIFYSPEKVEEKDEENGVICSNDEEERDKVRKLRDMVEKQDPSCKEEDDIALRRFLRACDVDVEKASAMLTKYFRWRRTFIGIAASEVPNQIAQEKVFMQGTDKRGCPIALVFAAKHFPNKKDPDELKRFAVFVLDRLCSRIPDGEEKFTIIGDLKGYSYSNTDVRGYIALLSILQDYYPERLNKLLLIHAPYIFMTAWKIIHPFIDKRMKKKIVFVENKKLHDTLLEEIEENQLPEIYGGKMQLVPIQDA